MKRGYKTPGVYIEEKNAFATSIIAVPTAVPAFIGYTEKSESGSKSLKGEPMKIESFAEYERFFGGAPPTQISLKIDDTGKAKYEVEIDPTSRFFMYHSMKMFYLNGGGTCYIVSVGPYQDKENKLTTKSKDDLAEGIKKLLKYPEPTMVLIPDAVLLDSTECYDLQKMMIDHCGEEMRNRIAILDVFNGFRKEDVNGNPVNAIDDFRENIGSRHLDFAVAYYPWLYTFGISTNRPIMDNISNKKDLVDLLKADFPDEGSEEEKAKNKLINEQILKLKTAKGEDLKAVEQSVIAQSPLFNEIIKDIREVLSLIPPCGAIAGCISYVDNSMGVAHSPANIDISGVTKPSIVISNKIQEDLNLPLNGKAINAIRAFPGKGIMIWGARTMDGNSQDWRYISVRRTMIMIEQSIKIAMGAYVFEPNNHTTWQGVNNAITNFLTAQWTNGVLAGATPQEAFSVDVGLGVTMTPNDILDNIMKVSVKVAVVRPAEFIVISFQQKMQAS